MSNDLQNHVQHIVNQIEQGVDVEGDHSLEGLQYLEDALDIEYIVGSYLNNNNERELLGARILVCFGGPNIWINTRTRQVEGYWWGESCTMSYDEDLIGLDDAIETLWNC